MSKKKPNQKPAADELQVGAFGVIKCSVKVAQIYALRDRGLDLGDISAGHLHAVGTNPAAAYKAAWELWQPRLVAIGCDSWEDWLAVADDNPAFFHEAAEAIRGWLSVFFPVIGVIQAEYQEAIAATMAEAEKP